MPRPTRARSLLTACLPHRAQVGPGRTLECDLCPADAQGGPAAEGAASPRCCLALLLPGTLAWRLSRPRSGAAATRVVVPACGEADCWSHGHSCACFARCAVSLAGGAAAAAAAAAGGTRRTRTHSWTACCGWVGCHAARLQSALPVLQGTRKRRGRPRPAALAAKQSSGQRCRQGLLVPGSWRTPAPAVRAAATPLHPLHEWMNE